MFDSLLTILAAAFVIVALLVVAVVLVTRWLFIRTAETMAARIDRHAGGAAAHALTRLAAYAKANGMEVAEAERRFGQGVGRLAHLMDSAVRVPLIGRIGLDVFVSLLPVVGDMASGAISLTLVARSLRYGPPPALVSKMLANVATDVILGAVPFIGPLADLWFRANERNATLMRTFLSTRQDESSSSHRVV